MGMRSQTPLISPLPSQRLNALRTQLTWILLTCSWSLLVGLVVVAVLAAAAYFFSPKGDTQL